MRLTLRTLLSWKDGMLPADATRDLAARVESSEAARKLVERIEEVVSRPTLSAPAVDAAGFAAAANSTAEYLDNVLSAERLGEFERVCFASDAQLAETAAAHDILAAWSREQPAPIDAAARRRLLAAVRARAAGGPEAGLAPAGTGHRDRHAAPRPAGSAPVRETPRGRTAGTPVVAWLLVAAAVFLMTTLVGVLGWSLTRGGKPAGRDVAARRNEAAAAAAVGPEGHAGATADDVGAAPAPAARVPDAPPPVIAAREPVPPPVAAAASLPREEVTEDAGPIEPDASIADWTEAPAAVPAAPPPVAAGAGDQRVPQGDALAIAAPAPAPAVAAPAEGPAHPAATRDAAATGAAVEGGVVLVRPVDGAADAWTSGAAAAPLGLPTDLVVPPFCRSALIIDGIRIALEPGTRAALGRGPDGVPRLEVMFGAATVAGAGPIGLTAGGLTGVVTAAPATPVGVDLALVRGPGVAADAVERVARIVPTAERLAWRPLAAAGGAGAPDVDIARGRILEWRSGPPAAAAVRAAGPLPPWLAGRRPDDPVERRAAEAVSRRLAAGTAAVPALRELAADRRLESRAGAAAALALLGEFPELARLMAAEGGEALPESLWKRLDAVAVQPALARGPRAADALARAIAAHLPPGAADTIVRFARGFTDEELADGAAAELVAALESPHLVVRRYAIQDLLEITAAPGVDRLRYRADRPAESLREGAAWWRKQLELGRIVRGPAAASDR